MIATLTRRMIRHPLWTVMLTVLFTAACAIGIKNIALDADYRAFFGPDNPQLQAFESLQDQYDKVDNALIAVVPRDGVIFSASTLAVIEDMTEAAWAIPHSRRVDSLTNFQYTYSEEDDLIVEPLFEEAGSLSQHQIDLKKHVALNDPVLAGNLIAFDGKAAGINLTINLPGINQAAEVPEVVDALRALIASYQAKHQNIDFYLTGVTVLNNAFPEASVVDITTLYPLMIVIILVLLFLSLKGFWGTFATFSIVIFSSLIALGLYGWPGVAVTAVTFCAPIMIMTLAIADCIHILMTYYQSMAKGLSKEDAMVESVRINFQPVFLTSITTAIGFLSLNFSDSPPFHGLGNIVCIGVIAAFFLALFYLPSLMMLLPSKNAEHKHAEQPFMQALAAFVIKHKLSLLVFMSTLIITLLALVPFNKLDDNVIDYFDWSVKFRADTEKVSEKLTGVQMINYSLQAGDEMDAMNPEYLNTIDQFARFLREQPGVRHVNSFSDVMKRLNKNMNADHPEHYRLPESRELAAQYMLLYELSLPYGLDVSNQVNSNKSATRMIVQLDNISSDAIIKLDQHATNWLRQHTPENMISSGSSANVMFAHIATRNIKSMMSGVIGALFIISLIIMVAIKSVRLGLISLIPNLIPTGMGFGLWALFDGEVGLSLSVVIGVTLGIVVDDTIHFLSKYIRAKREMNMHPHEAVTYAFSTVGVALTSTTLVLCAGFMVLTLSPFSLNSELGLMSAITIALALIVDFLFLPPLLLFLDSDSALEKNTAKTTTETEQTLIMANSVSS